MLAIILYFLVAYGVSFAFVESMGPFDVFQKIRDKMENKHKTLGDLFNCMFCFPTWVGCILSLIDIIFYPYIEFTPFNIILTDAPLEIKVLMDMFATASGVYLMSTFQEMMERVNKTDE